MAQHIKPAASWEDVAFPRSVMTKLKGICNQVKRSRRVLVRESTTGKGQSMLLNGLRGTDKTLASEVIANELKMDLYRIDLSVVVSKYIGETEKNLRRVFDAAEGGGAILFFDEADALFGTRSDVKDSHDRYANIEINYLLQRLEDYRGLAIFAANMKSTLDQAFLRRINFEISFPLPDEESRRNQWQDIFPDDAPDERSD